MPEPTQSSVDLRPLTFPENHPSMTPEQALKVLLLPQRARAPYVGDPGALEYHALRRLPTGPAEHREVVICLSRVVADREELPDVREVAAEALLSKEREIGTALLLALAKDPHLDPADHLHSLIEQNVTGDTQALAGVADRMADVLFGGQSGIAPALRLLDAASQDNELFVAAALGALSVEHDNAPGMQEALGLIRTQFPEINPYLAAA